MQETFDITLAQNTGTVITGSDFTVTSTQFTIPVPTSGYLQDITPVSFTIGGKTYSSDLTIQFNGPTITSIFNFSDTVGGDTLTSLGLTGFQLYGIGSTIDGHVGQIIRGDSFTTRWLKD